MGSSLMDIESKRNELNNLQVKINQVEREYDTIRRDIISKQTTYTFELESIGKSIGSVLTFASLDSRPFLESLKNSIQIAIQTEGKRVSVEEIKQYEQIILSIRANLEKEKEAAQEQFRIQRVKTTKVSEEVRQLEINEKASQKSLQHDIDSTRNQITSKNMQLQVRISEELTA